MRSREFKINYSGSLTGSYSLSSKYLSLSFGS